MHDAADPFVNAALTTLGARPDRWALVVSGFGKSRRLPVFTGPARSAGCEQALTGRKIVGSAPDSAPPDIAGRFRETAIGHHLSAAAVGNSQVSVDIGAVDQALAWIERSSYISHDRSPSSARTVPCLMEPIVSGVYTTARRTNRGIIPVEGRANPSASFGEDRNTVSGAVPLRATKGARGPSPSVAHGRIAARSRHDSRTHQAPEFW